MGYPKRDLNFDNYPHGPLNPSRRGFRVLGLGAPLKGSIRGLLKGSIGFRVWVFFLDLASRGSARPATTCSANGLEGFGILRFRISLEILNPTVNPEPLMQVLLPEDLGLRV